MDIIVTDLAKKKMLEIAKQESMEKFPIRLGVKGGGCVGLNFVLYFEEGEIKNNDLKLQLTDGPLVVVDPFSYQYLINTTVDYEDGLMGSGFRFLNDKIKTTCSCGNSFSM